MTLKKAFCFFGLLYFFGILLSFIMISKDSISVLSTYEDHYFHVSHVLKTFFINYFILFWMISLSYTYISYLIHPIFILLRGFSFGILIRFLFLKNLSYLFCIGTLDTLFFLPLLFGIPMLTLGKINLYDSNDFKRKMYLISILFIFIYSILLEWAGGHFGRIY